MTNDKKKERNALGRHFAVRYRVQQQNIIDGCMSTGNEPHFLIYNRRETQRLREKRAAAMKDTECKTC